MLQTYEIMEVTYWGGVPLIGEHIERIVAKELLLAEATHLFAAPQR